MDSSVLFQKYYNKALYFLSPRPRSEKEIREKLKSKKKVVEVEQVGSIIDQVINKLKEQNLINDEDFAKWWIEQRTVHRPKGIRLIKIELKQKGVSLDIIEATINSLQLTVGSEEERARKLLEKRLLRYKNIPKEELYPKLQRFLAARGFDFDTITDVLKTINLYD